MNTGDLIAGAICGVVAICASFLFHMTDRDRPATRSEPLSTRLGYLVICGAFILKATDFVTLAHKAQPGVGSVDGWSLLGAIAVLYHFANKALIILLNRLPGQDWQRVDEVIKTLRAHPEMAPAVIVRDDAPAVLQALGANVNARPGGLDDERTRDG